MFSLNLVTQVYKTKSIDVDEVFCHEQFDVSFTHIGVIQNVLFYCELQRILAEASLAHNNRRRHLPALLGLLMKQKILVAD